jgi:hypothetical protein
MVIESDKQDQEIPRLKLLAGEFSRLKHTNDGKLCFKRGKKAKEIVFISMAVFGLIPLHLSA